MLFEYFTDLQNIALAGILICGVIGLAKGGIAKTCDFYKE